MATMVQGTGTKFSRGQRAVVIVGGERKIGTIKSVVHDCDGFDGRGYFVAIEGWKPGTGMTLPEHLVAAADDFVAALTMILTTPEGVATLRELARK